MMTSMNSAERPQQQQQQQQHEQAWAEPPPPPEEHLPDTGGCSSSHASSAASSCADLQAYEGVLDSIFQRLPAIEQIITIGRLGRCWRAWTADGPSAAAARAALSTPGAEPGASAHLGRFALPLWLVAEAWPRLGGVQRAGAMRRAVFHGDLATVTWLHAAGCPFGADMCQLAAEQGHLDVLRYAHEQAGCPLTECAAQAAAHEGRLAALRWLHAAGCPMGSSMCRVAARAGHADVLDFVIREAGCEWDATASWFLVRHGSADLLRRCRDAGLLELGGEMPWVVAGLGHLEVLQYLVGTGCPFDREQCREVAVRFGRRNVLEWINGMDAIRGVLHE